MFWVPAHFLCIQSHRSFPMGEAGTAMRLLLPRNAGNEGLFVWLSFSRLYLGRIPSDEGLLWHCSATHSWPALNHLSRGKKAAADRKVGWMFYLDGAFSPIRFLPFFILFFMFWALAFRIKVWCSSFFCQQEPFLWLAERDALSSFMLLAFQFPKFFAQLCLTQSWVLFKIPLWLWRLCLKKKKKVSHSPIPCRSVWLGNISGFRADQLWKWPNSTLVSISRWHHLLKRNDSHTSFPNLWGCCYFRWLKNMCTVCTLNV